MLFVTKRADPSHRSRFTPPVWKLLALTLNRRLPGNPQLTEFGGPTWVYAVPVLLSLIQVRPADSHWYDRFDVSMPLQRAHAWSVVVGAPRLVALSQSGLLYT